ncbi:MAG: cupin domain-containing protein [Phascolarctobacterium sp.]|nr:cupin domain-containing protein [Phascolarctobacterium sp.]
MIGKEKKTDVFKNRFGGEGEVVIEHIIDEAVYGGKVSLFTRCLLKPGCSLGYHEHKGNSETYFILKGNPTYNDDGTLVELKPGDTTFCPEGTSHGIANNMDSDVVFVAIIVPA